VKKPVRSKYSEDKRIKELTIEDILSNEQAITA
jgi:hypothetical protein